LHRRQERRKLCLASYGRSFQQGSKRQFHAKGILDPRQQSCRQQGMPPKLKKSSLALTGFVLSTDSQIAISSSSVPFSGAQVSSDTSGTLGFSTSSFSSSTHSGARLVSRTSNWHAFTISSIACCTFTRSLSFGCKLYTNSHSRSSMMSRAQRIEGRRSAEIPCCASVSRKDLIHLRASSRGRLRRSCFCQGARLPLLPAPFPFMYSGDAFAPLHRSAIFCQADRNRASSILPSINK
jgi:hypothetical protein